MTSHYFLPGCSLFCRACNRTGHLAKSCSFRKVNELTHQCCFHGHLQRFLNRTILKIFFVVGFLSLCWQKYPICVLCGIQGHIQRKCPSRPCGRCGLPSHALKPCDLPPVWNQHCLRCGMTGHLSDVSSQVWPLWVLVLQSVLLCWRKRWKHLTVVCWQIL